MRKSKVPDCFHWAVPPKMEIAPDPLEIRLDFHKQSVAMYTFQDGTSTVKMVSAMDVAFALSQGLSYNTGLLPPNVLWWANTAHGALVALWEEARVRRVALQEQALKAPRRFTIPLPGLIFLCQPGKEPWVYAMKRKPLKETDTVYRAPLCNVFENGHTCAGNHKYPENVKDLIDSFFRSFFSAAGNLQNRSLKFPKNIVGLWEYLEGKEVFPTADLVEHGTVKDIMQMVMK